MAEKDTRAGDTDARAYVQIRTAMRKIEDRVEDGTLIVLKVHLVIEELIRTKLDEYLPRPEYINRAGLSFFQVLCVARAVYPADTTNTKGKDNAIVDLWDIIEAWNTLRNRLAHKLEPTDTQQYIRKILHLAPDWAYPLEHEETQAALSVVAGMLIASVSKLPVAKFSV